MYILYFLITSRCMKSICEPKRLSNYLRLKLFWTVPLRYLIEGYIELLIVFFISILTTKWIDVNFDIIISNVFSVFSIMVLLIYPAYVHFKYQSHYHLVDDPDFFDKYGDLYADYDLDRPTKGEVKLVLFSPVLFLLKRLVFVFICIFMQDVLWV